jgi:hypothetical protein
MYHLTDFDASKCADFNPDNNFQTCTYYNPADNPIEVGFCKKAGVYYRCLSDTQRCIPLSHSSIQDYLTCHYLYYLKAIRGIRVLDHATSSPLKCGKLWDSVIQHYYKGVDKDTGKPFDIPGIINQYEILPRDVAKVKGLYRAYKMLEIQIDQDYSFQDKIDMKVGDVLVTGYYDRKYIGSFAENKMSGSPDRYLDPYFIQSQIGTYFLADPNLEFCIMEIVRNPALKSTGSHKEEDPEVYGERIYQDAISRPSHYFIGYDSKTRRYGKKFFRSEFDLVEVAERFKQVYREIYQANRAGGWYKNDRACGAVLPGIVCDFLPLCRYNTMSESIYKIRERITF